MFAAIPSATILGAQGYPITVEVHVGPGLPGFQMVGLPDESCREARDRVRAALLSSGRSWPAKKITVNLSPSRHRKTGSALDLAIAVGILVADEELPPTCVQGLGFVGELGLDGSVRAIPGVAPMVGVLDGVDAVVPATAVVEAGVAAIGAVRPVTCLAELVDALAGRAPWPDHVAAGAPELPDAPPDLADVRGQPIARRSLEIAAAGGHHTLFVGPPGSGKTMLARRLAGLLPPLDRSTALETTMVHSAAGVGLPAGGLVRSPPFRAPHHTSSLVALVGGGSSAMRPGEISIAQGSTTLISLDHPCTLPFRPRIEVDTSRRRWGTRWPWSSVRGRSRRAMSRAIVYCRISRDPLGTELGVKRQERACRELCDSEGMDVVGVLVDDDRSAYSGKPRPAWLEVQRRVTNGDADVLVAWAADRLTRHPRELEDLVDLLEATRTRVRTVEGGVLDLTTADGRMVARMVGAMARRESEAKSARLRAKALELAEAGKVGGGGHRPFGYDSDRKTVRESEAEVIRWAVGQIVSGDSLRSVCRRMPLPTTTGKDWTPPALRRTLMSPRIAGLRQHRGAVVGDAVWDAVVDREAWERVSVLLADPRRKKWRPSSRYLLTGGLIRDHRGRPMVARPNSRGKRAYIAVNDGEGPGVRILADPVETMVLDACVARLRMGVPLLEPTTQDVAPQTEFEHLEAQMKELAELRGSEMISAVEWMAARKPLAERLETARAALGPVAKTVDLSDALERWEALSFEERRRAVHVMIQKVVVFPGRRGYNRFDPNRVLVVLAFGEIMPFD